MTVIQAVIHLDPQSEDFVEEWLWARGALAVSAPPLHETGRWLQALFPALERDGFQRELLAAVSDFGGTVTGCAFHEVAEEAWQEKWREGFEPLQVGSFRIVGEWEETVDDPRVIRVYPGQAFGTGQHQTTQLIIEYLEGLSLQNKRVLDAGCGTGILAIAAERLGAAEVFGFDVDPDCRENMRRHLRINRTERVQLAIGALPDFHFSPFDVILANITLNVLKELWPQFPALLQAGGRLISSGILVEQRTEAEEMLTRSGFQVMSCRQKGEWLLIEAGKP